jgi:hypothetical protein
MSDHTASSGVSRLGDGGNQEDRTDARRAITDPEQSVFHRRDGVDSLEDEQSDDDRSNSFVTTLKFVYRHSTALVPASLLWVVCSLPLVTVGPASLGVYSVVLSLRETGRVDRARVVGTVRDNLVPAMLLGFLPVTFVGIAALYIVSGLATGLVGTGLTAAALYAGLYVGVLLIPTFVSVAAGVDPKVALRESYVWVASDPVTGLQLLLVTSVLLVATVGLSVGFLLLFAGLAAVYHVEVVVRSIAGTESLPSLEAARQ